MARRFGQRAKERRDEQLSAYLDDQLGVEERVRLEARLAADPALRVELEALRRTAALVRDLPQAPLPRNFVLPQTAAARQRPAPVERPRLAWAAPLLTAATTVVGLFFAIVLVGDLLLAGGAMMAPRLETVPQAEPSVAMEYTAPEEEAEKAAQVVVTKEVEAERLGTEEVVPPAAPSAVPLSETTVASTSAETPAGEAADEVAAGAAAEGQETGETATTGTPAPMASPEPAEAVGGGAPKEGPTAPESTTSPFPQRAATQPPAPSANAEETPARAAEAAPPEAREVTAAPEPPVEDWDALASEAPPSVTFPLRRVLEIALGLATVGLALVTVWAWRARRR